MSKNLISFLDVTYLEEEGTHEKLDHLLQQVNKNKPIPAGVCVFPKQLSHVNQTLKDNAIARITVINFPNGNSTIEACLQEIEAAMLNHPTELDVVIPYQDYCIHQNDKAIVEFAQTIRQAFPGCLKFILESGALTDQDVYHISSLLCMHGADFIKTSTGKISVGATPGAAQAIMQAINDHFQKSNHRVGIKLSGGIRKVAQLNNYVIQLKSQLGAPWLNKDLFRIGASQLYLELLTVSDSYYPTV